MADEIQTSGAAARVFDLPELLEHILINVRTPIPIVSDARPRAVATHAREVKALFRLQRVNTTFRDVIRRSRRLRANMFKKDDREFDAEYDKVYEAGLTSREACQFATEIDGDHPEMTKKRYAEWRCRSAKNHLLPYLSPLLDCVMSSSGVLRRFIYVPQDFSKPDVCAMTLEIITQDAIEIQSDSAAWRDLLVINKAAVCILRMNVEHKGYQREPYRTELPSGATLGELALDVARVVNEWVENRKRYPNVER